MLKLGEKGTILQRDKETYAIAPHIPCRLTTCADANHCRRGREIPVPRP